MCTHFAFWNIEQVRLWFYYVVWVVFGSRKSTVTSSRHLVLCVVCYLMFLICLESLLNLCIYISSSLLFPMEIWACHGRGGYMEVLSSILDSWNHCEGLWEHTARIFWVLPLTCFATV